MRVSAYRKPPPTLIMWACSTLDRIAISKVTFPSLGSSIQQSSKTFSFLINFTTTYTGEGEHLYHLLSLVPTTGLHFSPSPKTTVMEEQVPVGSPCNRRQGGGKSQTEMLVISTCLFWARWDRWGSLEGLRCNGHCWRKEVLTASVPTILYITPKRMKQI